MTNTMLKYLLLEAEMLRLDKAGDLADAVRDQMDPIWYALSDEERARLNRRIAGQQFEATVQLPVEGVFVT